MDFSLILTFDRMYQHIKIKMVVLISLITGVIRRDMKYMVVKPTLQEQKRSGNVGPT